VAGLPLALRPVARRPTRIRTSLRRLLPFPCYGPMSWLALPTQWLRTRCLAPQRQPTHPCSAFPLAPYVQSLATRHNAKRLRYTARSDLLPLPTPILPLQPFEVTYAP
jgi:hypothetical protein